MDEPALLSPELRSEGQLERTVVDLRNLPQLQCNKQGSLKVKHEVNVTLLNGLQLVTIE